MHLLLLTDGFRESCRQNAFTCERAVGNRQCRQKDRMI